MYKIANIVTNATNTLLSHPAHSIILIYHPQSGWHVTSRNQGLSFASRRSKKDPGNEVEMGVLQNYIDWRFGNN
jgi:hypothetical protein